MERDRAREDYVLVRETVRRCEQAGVFDQEDDAHALRDAVKRLYARAKEKSMPRDVLEYFDSEHLPPRLQGTASAFRELAERVAQMDATDERERAVALRKLLEAKDAAVRSVL